MSRKIKDFMLLNAGTAITVLGIYLFRFPNKFAIGGVSGLAVVLDNLFNQTTPAMLLTAINCLLLIAGFVVFGKKFGLKTAYCTLLFSAEMWLLETVFPMKQPLTDQPLLELLFATLMVGAGSAILFNNNASSGGTDIIAMVLKKYSHLDIGKSLFVCDFLITCSTFLVFDVRTGLFSLLGLGMKTFVIDSMIESINLCKYFAIVTVQPDEICQFIIKGMRHSATTFHAVGAFSCTEKTVILTACRRSQALILREKIKEIDPTAFMFITNTSEIIGKGFRT